jgi:hypothetical protein
LAVRTFPISFAENIKSFGTDVSKLKRDCIFFGFHFGGKMGNNTSLSWYSYSQALENEQTILHHWSLITVAKFDDSCLIL